MTYQELKQLIDAFRAETQPDSITPDTLGQLLDKIAQFSEDKDPGSKIDEGLQDIADALTDALEDINEGKSTAESVIASAKTEALEDINEGKTTAESTIASAKNEALEDITAATAAVEQAKEDALEEIEELLETPIPAKSVNCGNESLLEIIGGDDTIEAHDVKVGYWNSSLTYVSSSGNNQKCGIFDIVGGKTYYVKYRNDGVRYTAFATSDGTIIGSNITSSSASSEKTLVAPLNASKLYVSNVYDNVATLSARFVIPTQIAPISVTNDVSKLQLLNRLNNENVIKTKTTSINNTYDIYHVRNFIYDDNLYEIVLSSSYTRLYKNGTNTWSSTSTIYKGAYISGQYIYLVLLSSSNALTIKKLDITTNTLTDTGILYTVTSVAYKANNVFNFVDYNDTVYMLSGMFSDGSTSFTATLYSVDFAESTVTQIATLPSNVYSQSPMWVENGLLYILATWRENKKIYEYDGTTLSASEKETELVSRQGYQIGSTVHIINGIPYMFEGGRLSKAYYDDTASSTTSFTLSGFLGLGTYTNPISYSFTTDGTFTYMSIVAKGTLSGNTNILYTYVLRDNWITELFSNNGKWVGFVASLGKLNIGETGIVPYTGSQLQVTTGSGTGVKNWYYPWGRKDLMRVTRMNGGTSLNLVSPYSQGECMHIYQPYRANQHLNVYGANTYRGTGMSKYGDSIWMAVTARPAQTNADYTPCYAGVCRTLNGGISFVNKSKVLVYTDGNTIALDDVPCVDGGTAHKGRLWMFGDKSYLDSHVPNIIAQYSDDNGSTWSEIIDIHSIITEAIDTTNLVDTRIGTTGGITLSNGTVVIMAEAKYTDKFLPFPLYTTDGENWNVGAICNTESAETQHLEKDGYLYITTRTDTNVRSGWNDGTRKFFRIPINNIASGTWEQVSGAPPVSYANSLTVGFGYCNGVWLMSCPAASNRNNISLYKSTDLTNWTKVIQLTTSSKVAANLAGYSSMIFERDMLRVTLEDQYYNILMYDLDYLLPYIFG